jgi:crossover junction endodeoxyribonuclease RuvC
MLVLGIDPGIALTGYGLIRDGRDTDIEMVAYGVVDTPANTPVEQRLQQIYRDIRALVEQYKPVSVGIEKLLFGKNVTTAMVVGMARGVTVLALADCGLTITEYTPATVKEAVAGYGNAPKAQMQEMVRLLLNLDSIPKPDDAADALAVAITHIHHIRYYSSYR